MESVFKGTKMNNKVLRLLKVVEAVADLSKNPKRRVGAGIFTTDAHLVSTGYNDLSKGIPHISLMYKQPEKDKYLVHAEENAIAQAAKYGHATNGCEMLITGLQPCSRCARLIVQAGIVAVYFPTPSEIDPKWEEDFAFARIILTDGGVLYEQY